jgi:membrane protease YdiL (CAAX protease family)
MVRTIRDLVRSHPVVAYYALTFAISWGGILVVVGPSGFTGTAATILVSGLVSLAGPSVAGVLLTWIVDGRAGLRRLLSRLLRWRVSARWYAVALLTGPVVMAATLFTLSAADPAFLPAIVTADDKLGLLAAGIAAGALVPVFEELGWTGFAMPRLRERHGVLATGLLMGLLWGVWHYPFFSGTTDASGIVPAGLLVAILLFAWLPAYRVLMVWVYDRTGSLLVAMLMHAPIVVCQYVLATDVSGAGRAVEVLATGAVYWIIALAVAWSGSRALGRTRSTARERLAA